MDLVVDHEVMELENVHHAHRHVLIERIAGTSVEKDGLARVIRSCRLDQELANLALKSTIKHRRRNMNTIRNHPGERGDVIVVQLVTRSRLRRQTSWYFFKMPLTNRLRCCTSRPSLQWSVQSLRGPAKVSLEDLTDIHPARNAERVKNNRQRARRR